MSCLKDYKFCHGDSICPCWPCTAFRRILELEEIVYERIDWHNEQIRKNIDFDMTRKGIPLARKIGMAEWMNRIHIDEIQETAEAMEDRPTRPERIDNPDN